MGNTIYVVNFSKNYHRNIKNNYLYSILKLISYETDCGKWFYKN